MVRSHRAQPHTQRNGTQSERDDRDYSTYRGLTEGSGHCTLALIVCVCVWKWLSSSPTSLGYLLFSLVFASRSVLSLVRAQLVHWDLFHILLDRSELRDEEITSCRDAERSALFDNELELPKTHSRITAGKCSIVSLCDLNLAEFF